MTHTTCTLDSIALTWIATSLNPAAELHGESLPPTQAKALRSWGVVWQLRPSSAICSALTAAWAQMLQNNGSLWLHVYFRPAGSALDPSNENYDANGTFSRVHSACLLPPINQSTTCLQHCAGSVQGVPECCPSMHLCPELGVPDCATTSESLESSLM